MILIGVDNRKPSRNAIDFRTHPIYISSCQLAHSWPKETEIVVFLFTAARSPYQHQRCCLAVAVIWRIFKTPNLEHPSSSFFNISLSFRYRSIMFHMILFRHPMSMLVSGERSRCSELSGRFTMLHHGTNCDGSSNLLYISKSSSGTIILES